MAAYIPLGRVGGVPVRFHVAAIAAAMIVAVVWSRPILGASLFAIVVAHEIGHAWFARRCGFDVVGIDFNLLGGVCRYRGKLTMRAESIVAWGGVIAQLVLGVVALGIHFVPKLDDSVLGDVGVMWRWPNLAIGLFNLIPAPAFDGGKAWRLLRPAEIENFVLRRRAKVIAHELETHTSRPKRPKKYDIN